MLDKLIKFGKKVKQTNIVDLFNVRLDATIIKEMGNVKVESYCNIWVSPLTKQYKGKTILFIEEWDVSDVEELIDNEVVDVQRLITHIDNIGLEGLANKLKSAIYTLKVIEKEDIIKSVESSEVLKNIFNDFIVYDRISEEERKEIK